MAQYRRVTKEEDFTAWKARKYTRAAKGKFRKSTKTISYRQWQEKQHGGVSIEKQIQERWASAPRSAASLKQTATKRRRKEMREGEIFRDSQFHGDVGRDDGVIQKYKNFGYNSLSKREKDLFKDIFINYEPDLVRGWLGSDERSRNRRSRWEHRRAA